MCDSHDHSHDHDCTIPGGADDSDGSATSLYDKIDFAGVRCLNEAASGMGALCLKPYPDRFTDEPFLASQEDDPEFILHVPFTEAVRIASVCVRAADSNGQTEVSLFVNRDDVDFAAAEELQPALEISCCSHTHFDTGVTSVIDYPAPRHRFGQVHSVTLHVRAEEADACVVHYVGFKGIGTNFRRGVVECVYESRPQAADHKAPEEAKASYIN